MDIFYIIFVKIVSFDLKIWKRAGVGPFKKYSVLTNILESYFNAAIALQHTPQERIKRAFVYLLDSRLSSLSGCRKSCQSALEGVRLPPSKNEMIKISFRNLLKS